MGTGTWGGDGSWGVDEQWASNDWGGQSGWEAPLSSLRSLASLGPAPTPAANRYEPIAESSSSGMEISMSDLIATAKPRTKRNKTKNVKNNKFAGSSCSCCTSEAQGAA